MCIYIHTQSALVSELLLQLFLTLILANGLDYLWTRNMSTRNYGTGKLCILHKSTCVKYMDGDCMPSMLKCTDATTASVIFISNQVHRDKEGPLWSKWLNLAFQSRIVESAHLAAQQSPPALVTLPQRVLKMITEASAPSSRCLYAH